MNVIAAASLDITAFPVPLNSLGPAYCPIYKVLLVVQLFSPTLQSTIFACSLRDTMAHAQSTPASLLFWFFTE